MKLWLVEKTDKSKGTIYKIVNKLNNKVYIGQTIMNVLDRWDRHKSLNVNNENEQRMPIKLALKKYGINNFEFSILEEVPRDILNDREIYWISYYNSYNNGYNATEGGTLGTKPKSISKEDYDDIISLYNEGFSLREIGREYKVDKKTIKNVLDESNIPLHRRSYKFTTETLLEIKESISKGISRKEIIEKYKISHSYLSQIITGSRRI